MIAENIQDRQLPDDPGERADPLMTRFFKEWRAGVLALLLVGPVLAYIGFGSIWLWQHGWLLIAAILWILAGTAFSILAARWTRNVHPIMPPLDWDSPDTFSPRDREAWKVVMEESEAGEALAMEALLGLTFISKRLAAWSGVWLRSTIPTRIIPWTKSP